MADTNTVTGITPEQAAADAKEAKRKKIIRIVVIIVIVVAAIWIAKRMKIF